MGEHVRFGWSPEATETFRWTSNKHPTGVGFNGQTDPKSFRWFKVAPPGCVFGQKDLKQAEARMVAHFARAENLLRVFASGANLYIEQGKVAFQREIQKDTPWYTLCKAIIHAAHYDEGPFKLAWDTGLSVKQAREFQENYHAGNPEIRTNFHQGTYDEVVGNGFLEVPLFKRRRYFYEALGFYAKHGTITDRQRKDAIAWRPQTLTPLIISRGMIVARPTLPLEVGLHLHGHDSIVWSCPPTLFPEVERIIDNALDIDVPIHGKVLNVPRETTIGYSLGDLMDYEGSVPTQAQWERWREGKQAKRVQSILEGVYGPHILVG